MNQNKRVMFITQSAVIATLYAALTYAQGFLLPGTTSFVIQFRASEALMMLALLTPAAIPGLTIGCFVFNIGNAGALPFDWWLGTLATLLAAVSMYWLRNVKVFKIPIFAALMPAIFNGIIVGYELTFFGIPGLFGKITFISNAICVAIGEAAVLLVLGLPFYLWAINMNKKAHFLS
ncbi:MAG: QueT transporter family protein [Bacillota bacterium]|nr:QueT transporter family protein [Bacillota bacterium]